MTRPIQPPMTDDRLDRLVRQLLGERAEEVAADTLTTDAMVERMATRLRPVTLSRSWVLLAGAAMLAAVLIGGALIVGGQVRLPSLPTAPPLASPTDSVRVRGWPDTTENLAGVYSWDGDPCGTSCISGFMHNGYGAADVEIRIIVVSETSIPDDGAQAVTVAGHDGIYRRIDAREEEWIVEIEGTLIAINLQARPAANAANLAEAHAIIDSMRTEPQDNRLGFRLVFTLTTDDWDSG